MIAVRDWFSGRVFSMVHGNNLVYNTCWEDPRLDRVALQLGPERPAGGDHLGRLQCAGLRVAGPNRVHAVDMNPRQNALLELKIAGIRQLEFEDFFAMFGAGGCPNVRPIYEDQLRKPLSPWSQRYWDRWIKFFDIRGARFYYRGTSGGLRPLHQVLHRPRGQGAARDRRPCWTPRRSRSSGTSITASLRERFWTRPLRFAMNRDATLSMVGVPRAQRAGGNAIRRRHGAVHPGLPGCGVRRVAVGGQLFLARVHDGGLHARCCPEYLKPDNFQRLKAGLVDRIRVHTDSLQGFLEKHPEPVSRFVLLDHMDWLADRFFPLLVAEWQAIVTRALPDAR